MNSSICDKKLNFENTLELIAKEFLNTPIKSATPDKVIFAFQSEIRSLYTTLKPLSDKPTEQGILDDIAQKFRPTENSSNVPVVARMFPKFYLRYLATDGSMECTLASAMFKLALEEKGFEQIYTVLVNGHQIAMREQKDGCITLYDPSTRWTDLDGKQHGFSETFTSKEVLNKKLVFDVQGKFRGYAFTIQTSRRIEHTGMFESYDKERSVYTKKFFASEPSTLVELAVILDNLKDFIEKGLYASLLNFDAEQTITALNIFNPKRFLSNK